MNKARVSLETRLVWNERHLSASQVLEGTCITDAQHRHPVLYI